MIPNVFVSSTIEDLKYLRDAFWEVIEDLAYHPVMSERSGVGYIQPKPATDSCYGSVQNCHLFILIIGKRYGHKEADGLSVTHKEFRAACAAGIPMITFVDHQILSYKRLYDGNPSPEFWGTVDGIDDPAGVFSLLSEVQQSPIYNGTVEIRTAPESKKALKLQLADFLGTKLVSSTVNQQISDVLAEVKTLRSMLLEKSEGATVNAARANRLYLVTRFLVDDRRKDYRELIEHLFPTWEAAIAAVCECQTIDDVLAKASFKKIIDNNMAIRDVFRDGIKQAQIRWGSFGMHGNVAMDMDDNLYLDNAQEKYYNSVQRDIAVIVAGASPPA